MRNRFLLLGITVCLSMSLASLKAGTGGIITKANPQYGAQSMYKPLWKVLVRRPDSSFEVDNPKLWHYTEQPNLANAQKEHDSLVNLLMALGTEVIYHDALLPEHADSIFVYDPAIVTNKGAIILRMGKQLRRGEEQGIEKKLNSLGIPTLFKLHGNATAEGGDILWLDENTVAVGRGYRTNDEGIIQLRRSLKQVGVRVITVDLPHYEGADCCLHLLSLISIIDEKKAVVYLPLLGVPFVKYLREQGYELIEVPEEEFASMGPNVLAVAPGISVALEGNPITKKRMEETGVKVFTYSGGDVSLKAEGGPTCLTRPLLRK